MKTNKPRETKKKCFLAYANNEAKRMQQLGHMGTARNYACAANRLAAFLQKQKRQDVAFNRLSSKLLQDFERWLKSQGVGRNTSSAYMRCLHAIYVRAAADGLADNDPFQGIYRGVAKTNKRAVAPGDIQKIAGLDIRMTMIEQRQSQNKAISGKQFEKQVERLSFARDLFMFCFCARGMTFVDAVYLRKSNIRSGTISYRRRKTGQKLMVKMEENMEAIVSRHPSTNVYLFPILPIADEKTTYKSYLNAFAHYNRALHELGKILGLTLTSYVSRHSWATIARQNDVPLSVISQAMGHDSEQTTEIYLKSLSASRIDQANHALLQTLFRS